MSVPERSASSPVCGPVARSAAVPIQTRLSGDAPTRPGHSWGHYTIKRTNSGSNNAISGGNYNYIFQESLNVPKRDETGRLDFNASDKTSMYIRYGYWWEDQQGAAVSAGNSAWGWLPDHYTAITPSGVFAITHIVSPTLIVQGTMGYQRFTEAERCPNKGRGEEYREDVDRCAVDGHERVGRRRGHQPGGL